MQSQRVLRFLSFAAPIGLFACQGDAITTTLERAVSVPSANAALIPMNVFGGPHIPQGHACKAAEYRQFDFWVGKWDVRGPAGGLAGTNVVNSKLDGCVVEENWTGAGVGRGRSLNFYDGSTGTWSQMWVASSGCASGIVMIEGKLENGSMTMRGRKEQPAGFQFQPPCAAPPGFTSFARNNIIRWTALPSGSVLQQFTASNNDNPLPELPPVTPTAGLRYDAVAAVTPLNPADPSFCPTRATDRQFDFMLGSWDVHQGKGNGAQGTATFTTDMQQCLIEEKFTGQGKYEGLSFNSYDVFTQKWARTYVDNDGQRLVMFGGLVNGSMVLVGTKHAAAGETIHVRVSWIPENADLVLQTWEHSRDGGASWSNIKELVYTRR